MKKEGVLKQIEVWFDLRLNEDEDENVENTNVRRSIMVVTSDRQLRKSSSQANILIDKNLLG